LQLGVLLCLAQLLFSALVKIVIGLSRHECRVVGSGVRNRVRGTGPSQIRLVQITCSGKVIRGATRCGAGDVRPPFWGRIRHLGEPTA
jgi:hypothetical protein